MRIVKKEKCEKKSIVQLIRILYEKMIGLEYFENLESGDNADGLAAQ